jgi:ribosomal protein S17
MPCRVNNAKLHGSCLYVHGNGNTLSGSRIRVLGNNNVISGSKAVVAGNDNIINGSAAVILTGSNNIVNGSVISDKGYNTVVNNIHENNIQKKKKKHIKRPTSDDIKEDCEAKGENACVICLSSKARCLISPCKHCCLCIKCGVELASGSGHVRLKEVGDVSCPLCRTEIKSIKKIFVYFFFA